ncbi:transcription termination factor 5, mitochondrial-like [Pectinophora gossypiella]|uniref:transcription termination factor 5, mitochondrial-like n=1 Tax=Pectinophora gossypiella TaxID=13191 RepID=UPI00214F42EF|nr:transcription termination factor 5, mitochondrial-like [Pectinophora gossypiella]
MILRNFTRVSLLRSSQFGWNIPWMNYYERKLSVLCDHLNINKTKAEYLTLKHPIIKKLTGDKMTELIKTLRKLGYPKETLVEEPLLFGMLPVTIKFRYEVLHECGFENVSPRHITSYLPLVKQKTIGDLKSTGEICDIVNVENRLASYMSQWPTSLTTLVYGDVNLSTLYSLRLKIIQRYLELVLDLTTEEFYRGLETYPTIKHRPLASINETLTILQSQINIPTHKIKSNLYLIHADPDNLKHIIYNFQSIGGIDIKEVIRMHPKIATKSYSTLLEIRKVFEKYNISNEAQTKCFDIYTLGPDTIEDRLEKAKSIPEFRTFFNHPRFLKMIYYNNTAMRRLAKLYSNNKKCLSLNILSGSSAHYETFEKAPGDRLGKGKDLLFCISQSLGHEYRKIDIRKNIKRHPYWINIPLVQVQHVYQQLSLEFSPNDIYQNCTILLYPWSKIKETLQIFNKKRKEIHSPLHHEHVDLNKLNKSQKLSLVLYLLEKNHYFTGNGVWIEEKNKKPDLKHSQEYIATSV